MTNVQLKKAVHNYVDSLDDNFLQIVHTMLETHAQQTDPIIGYDIDGTPLRVNEMKKLYEQDMKDMENGDFLTLEGLRKESIQWVDSPAINRVRLLLATMELDHKIGHKTSIEELKKLLNI